MKKLLCLFVSFLALQTGAQEILLRYNGKVGDAHNATMIMKQEVGTFMANTTEMKMSLLLTEVSDSSLVYETKFERIKMEMIQGENIINFDSSKKDEELDASGKMMKAQLDPILSAVITTTHNRLGKVLSIVTEPNIPQAEQMMDQNSFAIFPKKAVKVGSTWSDTKEQNGMIITTTFKVDSITSDATELSIGGDVKGMATGTLTGNMKLQNNTGLPIKSSLTMNMDVQGMKSIVGLEVEYTKK